QACRIGIGKHDRHQLHTAPSDEGDVVLRRPLSVRGQLEPGPVLDGLDDAAHDTLDQGGEDRSLVGEVLVQRPTRDPRLSADGGDGRLMEALARKARERGVGDLVRACVAVKPCAVPGSRHVGLGSPGDAGPQEFSGAQSWQRARRPGETAHVRGSEAVAAPARHRAIAARPDPPGLEGPLDSEKRPVARSRREVPCTRDAMAQADRCESGAGRIPGGIVMAVSGASWLVAPVGTHPQFTGADFTDDDLLYAKTAEDFVRGEVLPKLDEIEAKEEGLMPALLRRAGELGLLMVDIPERHGGPRLPKTTSMLVSERGALCASFSVAWGAHTGIGTLPIVYYGSEAQKAQYLPKLATGELLAAYALTEPGSGSDALAAKTRAERVGDGYRLTGTKQFITNAGF